MKTRKKLFSFVVVTVFLVIFCFFTLKNNGPTRDLSTNDIKYVKIAGQIVKVELAATKQEQERGLSGRNLLAENNGMLFIFPKPGKYFFWMKEMNFPIDIVWINENSQITYIEKNVHPSSYPETFGPTVDNSYVLEILAGFSEKNYLKEGDFVEFMP